MANKGADKAIEVLNNLHTKGVDATTLTSAKNYEKGQFPPGSMGPKIKAATDFIENGGKEVIITTAKELTKAIKGQSGTHIVR